MNYLLKGGSKVEVKQNKIIVKMPINKTICGIMWKWK